MLSGNRKARRMYDLRHPKRRASDPRPFRRRGGRAAPSSAGEPAPLIYVCIPVHDEARTVGVLLWKVRKVLAELQRDYEILVLDDASTDDTPATLGRYRKVLPLMVLARRESDRVRARHRAPPASGGRARVLPEAGYRGHPAGGLHRRPGPPGHPDQDRRGGRRRSRGVRAEAGGGTARSAGRFGRSDEPLAPGSPAPRSGGRAHSRPGRSARSTGVLRSPIRSAGSGPTG